MRNGSPHVRLLIDTNVFVSSLFNEHSVPARVVNTCLRPGIQLVISEWQRAEIETVLERPSFREYISHNPGQLETIRSLIEFGQHPPEKHLDINVRDPKDVPILAAAIAGDADYLITGDNDLRSLRNDPSIGRLRIVTPREFLETIADFDVD